MSNLLPRRQARRTPSRVALAAAVTLVGSMLAVVGASTTSQAATTVSPTEPPSTPGGLPVVREDSVDLSIDQGAKTYYRTSSGSFAAQGGTAFLLNTTTCRGDNPDGTNTSPRDEIVVTGPGGEEVLREVSPVRDISIPGALTSPSYQPLNPQPGPSNTNYRGDLADSGAYHGMEATLDLSGKPGGVYTVTTTTTNMLRIGSGLLQIGGPCIVGTPNGPNTYVPGPVVETQAFEYRPWQANFKDALGKGKVSANIVPREFTFSIGAKSAPVFQGSPQNQTFFSFGGHFLLPSDPVACAELITNCLPSGAVECEPSTGCVPRIMVINQRFEGTTNALIGVFDLATKAFIAHASVDGTSRVLFSLGTEADTLYHSLLQRLSDSLAGSGIDLAAILGTEVVVANRDHELSLSLLNGLQIDPTGPDGKGIRIYTPGTVQAGVILDVYSSLRLDGGACATNAASSADGPTRYTRNEDNGYTVNKTDLLPEVPSVGPLGLIVGGPVYNIQGKFTSSATPVANISSAVIGVDTAADEPNGYPVWISPFISGVRTGAPRTMDFLGTATWSASETPVLDGCLVVDFMLGTGVAVYDNPLPVGLHTLIDLTGKPSPALEQLQANVDAAVQQVLDTVTTNPVVEGLLGDLVASLPLSGIPALP